MSKVEITRQKILDAALDLFSEKGFHGITTRMIASHAGVNEVTIFRHFKTKEDLFNEVFDEVEKIGLCANKVIREDLTPREAIEFLIKEFISILSQNPKVVRMILFGHLDNVVPFVKAFHERNNLSLECFLIKTIEAYWEETSNPKNLDSRYLYIAIMTMTFGFVVSHTIFEEKDFNKNEMDDFIQHIFKIYLD